MRMFGVRQLNDFQYDDVIAILNNFTKVMVVRHPLVRVLSAFHDKLASVQPPHCHPYQQTLARWIRASNQRDVTTKNNSCVHDVTFAEFLAYFAHKSEWLTRDSHWRTYEDTCLPCAIQYDHVLKLETAQHDHTVLARLLSQAPETTRVEHRLTNLTRSSDAGEERAYTEFANVPRKHRLSVRKLYNTSGYLFGYTSHWTKDGLVTSCRYDDAKCC